MRLRYIAKLDGQRVCIVEPDLIGALDDLDPDPSPPGGRARKPLRSRDRDAERALAHGRREKRPRHR
jgi:hypothetical protein